MKKFNRNNILLNAVILSGMFLTFPTPKSYADTLQVEDYDSFKSAIEGAAIGELRTIELNNNITGIDKKFDISKGQDIAINGKNGYSLTSTGNHLAFDNKGTLSVINATVQDFYDIGWGGAIYNEVSNESAGILNIDNVSFLGNIVNHSGVGGGAIGNYNGNVYISGKTSFTNNRNDNNNGKGGAIYNGNPLNLGNAASIFFRTADSETIKFTSNNAFRGGAVYNSGTIDFIGNYIFSKNSSSEKGGAIFNESGVANIIGKELADGSNSLSFIENTAATGGGALYVTGTSDKQVYLNIKHADFKNNTSGSLGGAIYIDNYVSFNIENSNFIGNITGKNSTGSGWGGALGLASETDNVYGYVKDCVFKDNYSGDSGAAISTGTALTVINSEFMGNHSFYSGSAIEYNPRKTISDKAFKLVADGGNTVFSNNWIGAYDSTRTAENSEGLYIGNAIVGDDGKSVTGEDGNDSNVYFNAGNSGEIIFNDIVNALGNSYDDEIAKKSDPSSTYYRNDVNNPNIQLNQNGIYYSKFVETNAKDDTLAPTNGRIIFNNKVKGANLVLHNGTLTFGQKNTYEGYLTPDKYFDNTAKITLKGGTLDLVNDNIESKTTGIFNPESLNVLGSANLRLDVNLASTDEVIDYIDSEIKGNGILTIDKLSFMGDSLTSFDLGDTKIMQFAKANLLSDGKTELAKNLETVITSNAGYSLALTTTNTGKDSIAITKFVDTGGLPVALSLGQDEEFSAGETYIYNVTTDEEITKIGGENAWDKGYNFLLNGEQVSRTTSNKLRGSLLQINGNGKNIITSDNIIGIELGVENGKAQNLIINDVKKADGTGWKGFNSAIINHGGVVDINNSIFSNNASSVILSDDSSVLKAGNGGALYNESGIINIINTNFTGNTAEANGGAIYNAAGSTINLKADNSKNIEFINNTASKGNDIFSDGTINIAGDAKVIFNGGVAGSGAMNLKGGTAIANALIEQDNLNISNGATFNINAENLRIADLFENNGTLELTGGINTNNISGNGNTSILGVVINNANIAQNVQITSSGNLTSSFDNILGTMTNSGIFNLLGDLSKDVAGTGKTILNNDILLTDNRTIDGTLNLNEKTVDMQGAESSVSYSTLNTGNLKGTGNLKIKVNMNNIGNKAENSNKINIADGSKNNAVINLVAINVQNDVSSSSSPYKDYVDYITGNKTGLTYKLSGSTAGSIISVTDSNKYTFTNGSNGSLDVFVESIAEGLREYINGSLIADSYSINGNYQMKGTLPIGTTGNGNTKDVYINNASSLVGAGGTDGITVANGYTLNLTGSQVEDNTSTMKNFNTALNNLAGGTLNIKNMKFENNTIDIANAGELNLTGNNIFNSGIAGTGTTNINEGKTISYGSVAQNNLNILDDAILNINADNLNILNGVSNEGNLELTGGTLSSVINGSGKTDINGEVIANAIINNKIIINDSNKLTSSADNIGNTLTNKAGSLILTGGTLKNNVTGTGNTAINGNVIAKGDITQDDLSVNSSSEFWSEGEINSNVDNKGTTVVNAKVSGNIENTGKFTSNSDIIGSVSNKDGVINFNGTVQGSVSSTGGTLNFSTSAIDATGENPLTSLTLNGAELNISDSKVNTLVVHTMNLTGENKLKLDADLKSKQIDILQIKESDIDPAATITITDVKLMSDATEKRVSLPIFEDETTKTALINNIRANLKGVRYSNLYKYNVDYDKINGLVNFNRYSSGGYEDFNPSIVASPIAAQIGGYLTQLNIYEQAFSNMDMTMVMTKKQRQAMKYANKYASSQGSGQGGVITFSPNQQPEQDKGLWFRPFTTFESVGLKNGPKVNNTAYGSLFGGDSDLMELSNGWDMSYSVYAGYIGSHQTYDGIGIYQNGATLGTGAAWYKGNFYTGLTANVGTNIVDASTLSGSDDFTMLQAGIASKTGYNFEFLDGKFIVQPNYLMSYTFVNTFDYTNGAGVRIKSAPLNAIQLAPGVKFIGNLEKGWQPYASVQMMWNLIDKTDFKANDVSLPNLSVKPYVQYGVGLQKRYGNSFTAFGQTMLRNGGRNGISFQFGLRWTLGKTKNKNQNSNKPKA
jgi:predicted outer membrane repeat protein